MGRLTMLKDELIKIGVTTIFFASCFLAMMGFKALILAEYKIAFFDVSAALIGALVVAKVVLLLENVKLGHLIDGRSGIVYIICRTLFYGAGVFFVLLLEKAFEARNEYGGFFNALKNVFQHRDILHTWATAGGVSAALFLFNFLFVVRCHIGEHALVGMFKGPLPRSNSAKRSAKKSP